MLVAFITKYTCYFIFTATIAFNTATRTGTGTIAITGSVTGVALTRITANTVVVKIASATFVTLDRIVTIRLPTFRADTFELLTYFTTFALFAVYAFVTFRTWGRMIFTAFAWEFIANSAFTLAAFAI